MSYIVDITYMDNNGDMVDSGGKPCIRVAVHYREVIEE